MRLKQGHLHRISHTDRVLACCLPRPSYLPPASSLFSDDEVEMPASSSSSRQQQKQPPAPMQPRALAKPQATASSQTAAPSTLPSSSAGEPGTSSQTGPGAAPPGPPPLAKFARPPAAAPATATGGLPDATKGEGKGGAPDSTASGAATTVVVDLRHEVAQVAHSITAAQLAASRAVVDSSSDDDGDDWATSRKQIKGGGSPARPAPEPRVTAGPSRAAIVATGAAPADSTAAAAAGPVAVAAAPTAAAAEPASLAQPAVVAAAKAIVQTPPVKQVPDQASVKASSTIQATAATTAESGIGTGTDDLLLATGARRSFFVSTSDLPGDAQGGSEEPESVPGDRLQLSEELLQALARRHAASEAERRQRLGPSSPPASPAPAAPTVAAAQHAAASAPSTVAVRTGTGVANQDLKHLPPHLRFLAQQQQPGTGPAVTGAGGKALVSAGPGDARATVIVDLRKDVAAAASAASRGVVAGANAVKAMGARAGGEPALTSSMCDTEEDLQLLPSSVAPLPTNHSVPAALRAQQGVTVDDDGTVTLPAGFTMNLNGQGPRLPTGPASSTQQEQGQAASRQPAAVTANGTNAPAAKQQAGAPASAAPRSQPPAPSAAPPPVPPAKPAPPPPITPPPTAVTLPRLPAWLEPAGCLTLAFTSPKGLPSTQVATLCR